MLRIRRRLAGIILVRYAMPQPIALAHRDVIHLDGKEPIQAGLPGSAVHVSGNGKLIGSLPPVGAEIGPSKTFV